MLGRPGTPKSEAVGGCWGPPDTPGGPAGGAGQGAGGGGGGQYQGETQDEFQRGPSLPV